MKVKKVSINQIVEGYHPRKDSQGLEELKERIARDGFCDPIRVRPEKEGFAVIDGKRRLQVVKDLGWETVPCIITEVDEKTAAHQSYVLNAEDSRITLNPIEVALHIKEMRERFGYSVRDLVNLGYAGDDQTLYNKLSLLTLPQDIQNKIAEGDICPTIGYELARPKNREIIASIPEDFLKRKVLSVNKFKKKVRSLIDLEESRKEKGRPLLDIPQGEILGVFFKNSSDMSELPDDSVHLIVTSPPYGVGMEYEEGVSFEDHLKMLEKVLGECVRVLVPGGKICINFCDIHIFGTRSGGKPEIKLMGPHYVEFLGKHGLRLLDIITWKKCHPGKRDSNWFTNPQVSYHSKVRHGTYRFLRNTEHLFIFEKNGDAGHTCPPQIAIEEWKTYVDSVWEIPPVRVQKNHPAQFPEELPRRLIKMFSYKGEVILDPFGGTMTTVKVARELGRVGFGYELDDKYKPAIMKKLGITEGDLAKPEKKKVIAGLPDGEREEATNILVHDLLPAIVADATSKGERIGRLSIPLKRNLQKKDVVVERVSLHGDAPPGLLPPLVNSGTPDDYEDSDAIHVSAPSSLAKAA